MALGICRVLVQGACIRRWCWVKRSLRLKSFGWIGVGEFAREDADVRNVFVFVFGGGEWWMLHLPTSHL